MKKTELRDIIKEELKTILLEKPEKLDYTDRNQGFVDAANRLEKLKSEIKSLDLNKLANKKMIEYRYSRLGPMAADAEMAIDRLLSFIKFLKQDNSKILGKDGAVR